MGAAVSSFSGMRCVGENALPSRVIVYKYTVPTTKTCLTVPKAP